MYPAFRTWLAAISAGEPAVIPSDQLELMVQAGYCNRQCQIDLSTIPTALYGDCHSNLNRPVSPE